MQQILILPKVYKACVLCNNTLSIYSLPELSPDSTFKPISCLWVGGVDLNEEDGDDEGVQIVIGLKKRLRLVQITENQPPKAVKSIEYGGCLVSVRRETFSCAADSHSYALLDVMHQQKIGLFPISSLDPDAGDVGGAAETIATVPQAPSRSVSSASVHPHQGDQKGHNRSTSLNLMGIGSGPSSRTASPRPPAQRYGFDVPESLSRTVSPAPGRSPARSPTRPAEGETGDGAAFDKPLQLLQQKRHLRLRYRKLQSLRHSFPYGRTLLRRILMSSCLLSAPHQLNKVSVCSSTSTVTCVEGVYNSVVTLTPSWLMAQA